MSVLVQSTANSGRLVNLVAGNRLVGRDAVGANDLHAHISAVLAQHSDGLDLVAPGFVVASTIIDQ